MIRDDLFGLIHLRYSSSKQIALTVNHTFMSTPFASGMQGTSIVEHWLEAYRMPPNPAQESLNHRHPPFCSRLRLRLVQSHIVVLAECMA